MDETFLQMRDFIMMTENLDTQLDMTPIELEPESILESASITLLEDLADVIFKLRAFMESEEGDMGLGVELGMQRAADMIENVIRRHTGDVDLG